MRERAIAFPGCARFAEGTRNVRRFANDGGETQRSCLPPISRDDRYTNNCRLQAPVLFGSNDLRDLAKGDGGCVISKCP